MLYFLPGNLHSQCSSLIDLNTWTQQGPAANGNWNVNAAGTSLTQTINGFPTFFVSPQSFINVRMTGTISTTGGDDDFIGFVFGYREPINQPTNPMPVDTWLFDWKRGTQTVNGFNIQQGRYLSYVQGTFDLTVHDGNFWGHQAGNGFNTVASTTGGGTGWAVGTTYNFELTYLSDRAVIVINNDTFFDYAGCFEPGRFGFYNYSQNPVVYSNFSYTLLPAFVMASNSICLNDSAQFSYSADTCSSAQSTYSVIASWDWDFGDGNTSNQTNPSHLYASPGVYQVELVLTDTFGCTDSLTLPITVTQNPPTPSASNNSPICEGNALNLTGVGSGGGLTYNWVGPGAYSSSTQNPVISPAVPANSGDYILTVSDGTCTSDPDTTNVTVNPTPATPTVGSNTPICEDSTILLTASSDPGATYTWSGPNAFSSNLQNPSIPNATLADGGVYSVFATLNTCQSAAANVNIGINPTPVVNTTGDTSICIGSTTTLTASGASSYQWTYGPTTAAVTVGPAVNTYYQVTGTTAGCPSVPDSIEVTVHPLPIVNLGSDTTVCDSLVLDAGPGLAVYDWNTGAASQSIIINTTGTYWVTVMTADSCFASDTINVTIDPTPFPVILGLSPICYGDSTILTVAAIGNIQWSTGETTQSITVAPTSDSLFMVSSNFNGCQSGIDTFLLVVNPLPIVNLGPDLTVCDQVELDAGPAQSAYLWSNGDQTQTTTVTTTGTYSVTVTDGNSCEAADTINVTVNNTIPVDLGPDFTVCTDSTGIITSSPPGFSSYLWSTNAVTPSITAGVGSYYVDVTDVNGCPSSDTIVLTEYTPMSGNMGNDTLICDGETLTINAAPWGAATYNWNPGGATTSSITVSNPGLYIVEMDDGNGCLFWDSLTLTVDVPPAVTMTQSVTDACEGDPIVFTASPTSFSIFQFYVNGNISATSPSNTFTSTTLQNGDAITVTGTTVAGCPISSQPPLTVNIVPRPSGVINTTSVCETFVTDLEVVPSAGATAIWSGVDGLSGAGNNITHTYSTSGTFGFNVTLDNGLCQTILPGTATVFPEPSATIAQDRSVCEGADITLVSSGGNVEWYDAATGGNIVDMGNEFTLTNVVAGDTFWVQQTSNQGCVGPRSPVVLTVNPNPIAEFFTQPDTAIEINLPQSQVNFFNTSINAQQFLWFFGDGMTSDQMSPHYTYTEEGTYDVTLIATTNEGCSDTFSLGPYPVVNIHNVFIPSAFTPDGNDLNDLFEIVTYGVEGYDIDIFDRWGKLIFSNNGDPNAFWDGTFNGQPVPEGAYVYKLSALFGGGRISNYQGTITLLR